MKKLFSLILSISIFAVLLLVATSVSADEITVELDGSKIEFDVNPEIIEGRTMVPLRKIFEEIGATVKWNNDTRTVTARKNSKTITLAIDSTDLQIDKGKTDDEGNPIIETVSLEVPAQIVSDRTLVPARAVSESFGLNVEWDNDNRKVIITSDDDEDDSWKENVGAINLTKMSSEGDGIEIDGNQIKITNGGDFTVTGTLADGNIIISAKEKVKLRLSGANITSSVNPCIFVEKADKAYITLTDGTDNMLIASDSEDGAIYSKENLEIKGDGTLKIKSENGHGIKASDNLTIENGDINIVAASDGIHINDTFKMTGGVICIESIGDGIDCESIVNISDGCINIETNGKPIERPQSETNTENATNRRPMWENNTDVEFEKSTKGINAEWMMIISDGEININSASHAIHCQDEIEINGGKFILSSKYDKGISAHGNLTINGSKTYIDIQKSTEGIESKNVMTINDGEIKIVSSDDAINATGGSSGMVFPGGNFAGNTEGGNRVMPEGFERAPGNNENQTNQRPKRGTNGQFEGPLREGEIPFNGGFVPPFEIDANGEFVPPFEIPENGMFVPDRENRPQFEGGGTVPGGMGGMNRDMKECLIINGGNIEVLGGDDCIDANGNLVINGGTVKATYPSGSFSGNFGILDSDGKLKISETASLVFAAGSGRSLSTSQNSILVYCEAMQESGGKISVSDSNGNLVIEYVTQGNYKAVLIASDKIKTGEKYSVAVGNESYETEIAQQSTVIGTQPSNGSGFGRGQRMQ